MPSDPVQDYAARLSITIGRWRRLLWKLTVTDDEFGMATTRNLGRRMAEVALRMTR